MSDRIPPFRSPHGRPMSLSDTTQRDATDLRIAVLVSRYHDEVTSALEAGARDAFAASGGDPGRLEIFDSPGAFELAGLAGIAISTGRFDGVVCLGCVVRGETTHDAWINGAVANELAGLSTRSGVPVSFGVLTVQDLDQAKARSGGARGNKGAEAMNAAVAAACIGREIRKGVVRDA